MSTAYWAVFRAAVTVGGLSVVVKLVAVGKEGLVGYRLGTAPELDAFLIAYAFPAFLVNVFTGALAAAFVPLYVSVSRSDGERAAMSLTMALTWVLLAVLVAAAAVLAPISSTVIRLVAVRFDADTLALATSMVYALMPVLVLNGLTGFWSGFLNARHRFAVAALAPIATPAAIAVTLIFWWSDLGAHAIVAGTLVGGLCELLIVGAAAGALGLPFRTLPAGARVREILPEFSRAAAGNLLIGATVLVDQAMASALAPGSVAALGYGIRVPGVIVAIGSMALATALLPHLSRLVADRRFDELRVLLREYSILTVIAATLVTGVIIGLSQPIIGLLFERGSFGPSDTQLVAAVQAAYSLHIPFFAWAMIAVRLISAMQANHFLMIGSGISLVLDIVLNWVLSAYLGVVGIALATAVVYLIACVYLWAVALARLKHISSRLASPLQISMKSSEGSNGRI